MNRRQNFPFAVVALLAIVLLAKGCAKDDEPGTVPESKPKPFVASNPADYRKEVYVDMSCIVIPMFVYYQHVGELPTTEEGLEALISGPKSPELYEKFAGPYLLPDEPDLLVDPWGRGYIYRRKDEAEASFDLRSLGADGVESSDDISYREFPEIANLIR